MVAFGCPSCARAIEQAGRRIAGVREIRVDLARHEIRVTCDADRDPTAALTALVQRLGHDLRPRTAMDSPGQRE